MNEIERLNAIFEELAAVRKALQATQDAARADTSTLLWNLAYRMEIAIASVQRAMSYTGEVRLPPEAYMVAAKNTLGPLNQVSKILCIADESLQYSGSRGASATVIEGD